MSIFIGSTELSDFEIPSVIQYGGTQRLITHYLGSGRRVIDVLGPEEADIRFSGIISGLDARTKMRSLDDLRRRGAITTLRWSGFDIPVILRQFLTDYRTDSWIQYSLTCAVVDTEPSAETFKSIVDRRTIEDRLDEVQRLMPIDLKAIQGLIQQLDALLSSSAAAGTTGSVRSELDQAVSHLTAIVTDVETRLSLASNAGDRTASAAPMAPLLRIAAQLRSIIASLKAVSMLSRSED